MHFVQRLLKILYNQKYETCATVSVGITKLCYCVCWNYETVLLCLLELWNCATVSNETMKRVLLCLLMRHYTTAYLQILLIAL